jgi:hypothetical protein
VAFRSNLLHPFRSNAVLQTVEDRILILQEKKAMLAQAALGADGAKKMNKANISARLPETSHSKVRAYYS